MFGWIQDVLTIAIATVTVRYIYYKSQKAKLEVKKLEREERLKEEEKRNKEEKEKLEKLKELEKLGKH